MKTLEEINKNIKLVINEKCDIDEFLDVLNFREKDAVNKELLPSIKTRLDKIEHAVNNINELVLNYKNKFITTNGCTYDILRPCGKIEIGLHAPNKEFLIDLFKKTNEDIQILRVINENGIIVESYEPHWTKNDFEGFSGGSINYKDAWVNVHSDSSKTSKETECIKDKDHDENFKKMKKSDSSKKKTNKKSLKKKTIKNSKK